MKLNNNSDVSNVVSPLTGGTADLIELIDIRKIVSSYKDIYDVDISDLCEGYTNTGLYECKKSGLKFFHPMITGDEKFYQTLQKYPWYYQDEKSEWLFTKEYTKNKSIVEIGCGEGKFSKFAEASEYVGLELNGNAAKVAVAEGLDVRRELSSAHVQERSGYYDVVCSFQVLEHVEDINSFVNDSVSLCRPGGLVIFSVPNDDGFVGLVSNNFLNMPPHHVSRWSYKALEYLSDEFEMDLLDLHKDEFDMIHYEWYARTLGSSVMRSLLSKKNVPLVTTSISDRIIEKLGKFIGKKLLSNDLLSNMLPAGHSVTAVYRKNNMDI